MFLVTRFVAVVFKNSTKAGGKRRGPQPILMQMDLILKEKPRCLMPGG